MNRDKRRKFIKEAKKKGIPKEYIDAYLIKELSKYNMFVQFIGIGNEDFEYLKSLDDMKGRKYDNTGFTAVRDMNRMTDDELYTEILRQYKDWLNAK